MATDLTAAPSMQAGDRMSRDEFIRVWEQLPGIKKAELIGGVVYLPSPLSVEHGDTDFDATTWLGLYKAATPGCAGGANTTSYILEDCPQPDINLRIVPECGGQSRVKKKYLHGSPELLTEESDSSKTIDLCVKRDLYEKARVQEYLVILVRKKQIRWHRLVQGKYKLMLPDADGVYRSQVFPGLWLDCDAFFAGEMAEVLATLQKGIGSDEHQQFVEELAKRKRKAK